MKLPCLKVRQHRLSVERVLDQTQTLRQLVGVHDAPVQHCCIPARVVGVATSSDDEGRVKSPEEPACFNRGDTTDAALIHEVGQGCERSEVHGRWEVLDW